MIGRKFTNGMVVEDSMSPRLSLTGDEGSQALEMWENDDMTLDMLTDVNEDEVDEDVRPLRPSLIRSFCMLTLCRHGPRCRAL